MNKQSFINFYDVHYKKLLFISITLLVLAIAQIAGQYFVTGDFINKGISLKGGSTITIDKKINVLELQSQLQEKFPKAEISVRSLNQAGQQIGIAIDSDAQSDQEIQVLVNNLKERLDLIEDDYTVEIVGSSLGQAFFRQTLFAVLLAFFFMGLVVFLYFRKSVPSFAVILSAFSDITITLAIFNITGIKLSTAGIAAFLMLIGYSVDTDILLATHMIKRKEGTHIQKILRAMKTGFTMSFTTIFAILLALIFTRSAVIKQIMIILIIGLCIDLINTWIQNAAILRIYLKNES